MVSLGGSAGGGAEARRSWIYSGRGEIWLRGYLEPRRHSPPWENWARTPLSCLLGWSLVTFRKKTKPSPSPASPYVPLPQTLLLSLSLPRAFALALTPSSSTTPSRGPSLSPHWLLSHHHYITHYNVTTWFPKFLLICPTQIRDSRRDPIQLHSSGPWYLVWHLGPLGCLPIYPQV